MEIQSDLPLTPEPGTPLLTAVAIETDPVNIVHSTLSSGFIEEILRLLSESLKEVGHKFPKQEIGQEKETISAKYISTVKDYDDACWSFLGVQRASSTDGYLHFNGTLMTSMTLMAIPVLQEFQFPKDLMVSEMTESPLPDTDITEVRITRGTRTVYSTIHDCFTLIRQRQ
ncbi:unnamed protein product [Caretta caretta]